MMDIDQAFVDEALPDDLNKELLRLSKELTQANVALKDTALDYARKEHAYRRAKAHGYLAAKIADPKATIDHIKALVDKTCDKEREESLIAGALKESSLELVRSLRAQLSALQTISNTVRGEMEMAGRMEPRY